MGSKQEKRLAKGLKALAKLTGTTDAVAAVEAAVSPERTAPELAAELPLTMAEQDAREVVAELPELVPDIANPEGVPPVEATEPPAAPQAAPGPILQVKQGLALRGGRGEWYKLLCQYDGKPVADYIAAGKANPASHYTARSTKCGQPKTPESRLSWFKRAGIVTIK
jgi:hypothetical protein